MGITLRPYPCPRILPSRTGFSASSAATRGGHHPPDGSLPEPVALSLPLLLPELSLPFSVLFSNSTFETPALVSLPMKMPCVPQKKLFSTVTFLDA